MTESKAEGVTMRDIGARQGRLPGRVQVKGSGPPLVFLHGLLGIHWGSYLDRLAEDYTVYAPEYPGTSPGRHESVYAIHDLLDLMLYYDEVFEELGIEPAVVVGESFGAMIALEYAAVYPGRVRRLVCAAPYGLWGEELPIANYGELPIEDLPALFSARPDAPEVRSCFPFELTGDEYTRRAAALIWSLGVATKFLWPIPERGLERRIHRVGALVRLLWGAEDRIVPSAYAATFAGLLPDGHVEVVPGAGHALLLDAAETATRLTLDFVRADVRAGGLTGAPA